MKASQPHETSEEVDKVLLAWSNYQLKKVGLQASDVRGDMHDGFFLFILIDIVTGEQVPDYHSRMFADVAILEERLVESNQKIIAGWVLSSTNGENGNDATGKCSHGNFEETIQRVLWLLIQKSVPVTNACIYKMTAEERFKNAKELFEKNNIPFLFEDLNLEERGSLVLARSCILFDKICLWKGVTQERATKKWLPAPQRYITAKPLDPSVFDQRVVRIFLSSTFRDMQKERDFFFQNGATELRRISKEKGVDLVFIDLRWGLTSEDSNEGWVVIRCLESIGKCPYIVCSLGARYGWTPYQSKTELNKLQRLDDLRQTKMDATINDVWVEWRSETCSRFPFINSMPGLSVTEYEIQYAALIDNPACSRAFFYFRDEQYAVSNAESETDRRLYMAENEESRQMQDHLKSIIKERYGYVVYQTPKNYSELVTAHLAYAISRDFGERRTRDSEEQAHHQYKMHRLTGFGGRGEILRKLMNEVTEQLKDRNHPITFLAAEPGIGKSSIIAATIRELENSSLPGISIFYHFVGCTSASNYADRLWKHVCNLDNMTMQQSKHQQGHSIHDILTFFQEKNRNYNMIILIDGVNQLHSSRLFPMPHLLHWLPKKCPENVAVIVSTINSDLSCQTAIDQGLVPMPLYKLSQTEIEESVFSFLQRFDKTLSKLQLQMILDESHNTGHPLYLRIILDEIRVFGVYEKLDDELQSLLSKQGVTELFYLIINRWQAKWNLRDSCIVDICMKVLLLCRVGLSEEDLDEFVGNTIGEKFDFSKWKTFFFTILEYLFVRNGRYMYFHQLLVDTVENYFYKIQKDKCEFQRIFGTWLYAKYSTNEDVDQDIVSEICFQLSEAESFDLLVEHLKNEKVVVKMLRGPYRYEFFKCWRLIHAKGVSNYKDVYKTSIKSLNEVGDALIEFFLEQFENIFLVSVMLQRISKRSTEDFKAVDYMTLGRIYKNLHNWKESIYYFQKCLALKEKLVAEDSSSLAQLHDEMGFIYEQEHDYTRAVSEYKIGLEIRSQNFGGDDIETATSHDILGTSYLMQKRIPEAKLEFDTSMEIRMKKVGYEHPLIALSLQNLGHILLDEKRYEECIQTYQKAKTIFEKSLGEKHLSVATCMKHLSRVYLHMDRKQDALSLLDQVILIYTEGLGENHPDVVSTLKTIGAVNYEQKQYKLSLEAYKKVLSVQKITLGDGHVDYIESLECAGCAYHELQSHSQTFDCFQGAAKLRKQTKTIMSVKDVAQCASLIALMKEKNGNEAVVQLYKTLIYIFNGKYHLDYQGTWNCCQEIDKIYRMENLHSEAIEFWIDMRDKFTEKLGWFHERTLNACEYLSYYQRLIGVKHEPVEYTMCRKFIHEVTGYDISTGDFDFELVILYLFKIVYSSRVYESKSTEASNAMTLLNFMNISFTGMDLSYIRIPAANLSNSILDGANFTGANLDGVNLGNSILGNCIFNDANMSNVRFGVPYKELTKDIGWVLTILNIQGPKGENWLVSGGRDDTVIHIWDLTNGHETKQLKGHKGGVRGICRFHGPNAEDWLVSASDDKTIRLWDLKLCVEVRVFEGHTGNATSVCYVNGLDGQQWVASGSWDNTIRIWDIISGAQVKMLEGHTGGIRSVCLVQSPKEHVWIASGSNDCTIRIWDVTAGMQISCLNGHSGSVFCVCMFTGPENENWIVSGSKDKSIRVWDYEKGCQVLKLDGHTEAVTSVCNFEGPSREQWIASASDDKTVRLWDLSTKIQVKEFSGHKGYVNTVCNIKGPNGEHWLASGSADNTIHIWDLAVENQIKVLESNKQLPIQIHFARGLSNENWLVYSGEENKLHIRDLESGGLIKILEGSTSLINCVCVLEGHQGCPFIVTGGVDRKISIWNIATGACFKVLTGHTGSVFHLCGVKGPKGENWFASGGGDKTVRIWDTLSGRQECCFKKNEITHIQGVHIVRKESPGDVIALLQDERDAINLIDSNRISARKFIRTDGSKKLVGGDIQMRNVQCLNSFNKDILFSLGAASFDIDFVTFCENGKYTKFQANMVVEFYENGWVVERDIEKAVEWFAKAENFDGLKRLAKQGSKDAFNVLKEISVKIDEPPVEGSSMLDRHKYSEVISILDDCYENGWGVEKDLKKTAERYALVEDFDSLKTLAQKGSREAFDVLMGFAQRRETKSEGKSKWFGWKLGEKYIYPRAVSIVAECYDNGWGVQRNPKKSHYWKSKLT